MQIGFRKIIKTTLVRTKYQVVFRTGMRMSDLRSLLAEVPATARVGEVIEGDDGLVSIEFSQEQEAE